MLSEKTTATVSTVRHQSDIVDLRKSILRTISELRQPQRILMPELGPVLDKMSDDEDAFKLLLPSELSADDRGAWCPPDISTLEFRFRYAQADDSLAELRRLLRLTRNLRDENSKHLSQAQKALTRTKGIFQSFRAKITRSGKRYSNARNAMLALDPDQKLGPGWMDRFKVLQDDDARGPGREEGDTSEGQFKPSWIWLVPRLSRSPAATTSSSSDHVATTTSSNEPAAASDLELLDSMRAHWAKCQARAERYEEETALTLEEMGRTLLYFEWKQAWWLSLQSERENSKTPPPEGVQRGLRAYAQRQANVYENITFSFANKWRKTLCSHNLYPSWLSRYPAASDPQDCSQLKADPKFPHASNDAPLPPSTPGDVAPMTNELETSNDVSMADEVEASGDEDEGESGDDEDEGESSDDDEYVPDAAEFDLQDDFMS